MEKQLLGDLVVDDSGLRGHGGGGPDGTPPLMMDGREEFMHPLTAASMLRMESRGRQAVY